MTDVDCDAIQCKYNFDGESCDRLFIDLVEKEYKLEDGKIITVIICDEYELDVRER